MDIYCSCSTSWYVIFSSDRSILFLFVIYWNEPNEHESRFMFDFEKRTVSLVERFLYSYRIM